MQVLAVNTTVLLVDDLEGGPAEETVLFSLDGISYEIDVNDRNAKRLRDLLRRYAEAGRYVSGSRLPRASPQTTERRRLSEQIRSWAAANGYPLVGNGRIPRMVLRRYHECHGRPH